MTLALILAVLASLALLIIALTALMNVVAFPRLGRFQSAGEGQPLISILVPARNEASHIGDTVRSLLAQTYRSLQVIVLDDQSDDGTAQVALSAAQGDPRLQVMSGQQLPPGWLGKNWACHQLSQKAHGTKLIFTDADVRWEPTALEALVGEMTATKAGLLTVWPTQHTVTWAERLVVPLMAFTVMGYLPVWLVHHTPWPVFAAANGQCLAFQRAAYERVGGHAAVRDNIVEDIALAKTIKARGLQLRTADGAGLIRCRMYDGWPAVRDGYAKNILAGFGGVLPLLLGTLFHWMILLVPWLWLLAGALQSETGTTGTLTGSWLLIQAWPLWPAALIGLGIGARALTAIASHQRAQDALLLPLSAILMTVIAGRALWWQMRQGGPNWKGRSYTRPGQLSGGPLATEESGGAGETPVPANPMGQRRRD
jgi:chlorobactene glucosyltransferase